MPNRTVNEIIDDAYLEVRVLTPKATDDTRALRAFQNMLSSWSAEGLLVPYYDTENFTLTIGKAVYTIGSGGDLNTVRPVRMAKAFIRISDYDYNVAVDMTKSEYSDIASKGADGRPRRLYYDPQYPLGNIKFDYEADEAYDFHLISEKPLLDVAAITDTLSLPLEMNEALVYNLAIRLASQKKIKLEPHVFALAKSSKMTLERINSVDKLSDSVPLDNAILSKRGYSMDIYTGGR